MAAAITTGDKPKTTEQILLEEANAIHGEERVRSVRDADLYDKLYSMDSAALCLSGGGIRSASFALGVLQALATHPRAANGDRVEQPQDSLLAQFHYLSTVSGGGYIGSWLSAWVTRAGFAEVWSNLVGRPLGPDVEPPAIAWLRSYSNFLTPKLGLTSADFWSALAIGLRNLILNWLVILPVFCLAILALKGFSIAVEWFAQFDPQACGPWFFATAPAACVSLFLALYFTTRNRPTRGTSNAGQTAFLWRDLAPAVLSGIFFTFAFASPCAYVYVQGAPMPAFSWSALSIFGVGIVGGLVIYLASWIAALPKCRDWKDCVDDLMAWLVAGAVYGALMALGVYIYVKVYGTGLWLFKPSEVLLIVFGVPWALTSQLLAEMIFVAFTSYEADSDSDREWLGRAAGWYLLAALGWPVLMFLVSVVPWDEYKFSPLVESIIENYSAWAPVIGAVTGALTLLLGKSGLTPATGPAKDRAGLSANLILSIAAPVFAVILIAKLSAVLDQLLFGNDLIKIPAFTRPVFPQEGFPDWPGGWSLLIGAAIALLVGAVGSIWVNINRFSLHAMYRNRLIRAFLGAAHGEARRANKFTDFDVGDNPKMHELRLQHDPRDARDAPNAPKPIWRPFHVVNIALNIVSTKQLAWQERKAESFTVSALHSGTACGGLARGNDGTMRAHGAYRPSREYGGGISLGTALAISGAAASPNMGYNSSPAVAFLMTLFNVRLGWWLGNPAIKSKKVYGGEGPRITIVALLSEMLGHTNDDSTYVYLSDGGHFENLGIYEMVRRRCRYIIVSDAGCDPDFRFEDLGNAVRKIALDLGVTITFHGVSTLRGRAEEDRLDRHMPKLVESIRELVAIKRNAGADHKTPEPEDDGRDDDPLYAVGTIDYGPDREGFVLYIKAAYHKGLIKDVGTRSYAVANPDFPHQSTADQFFSESQFESYRALGFELTDAILEKATEALRAAAEPPTLDGILRALSSKAVSDGTP